MVKQDSLRRFLFAELGLRGAWVQLGDSWREAKQHQQGEANVQLLLGQALAAVVMLSATIKFNGSMILQTQGDGAIRTLVAQTTHDRKIRGLVRANDRAEEWPAASLLGNGRLVLTIAPNQGEPYQGIVALAGDNLATALETYFLQSEQLQTRLWLFADDHHAAGLMLQELPQQQQEEEDWERLCLLADTATAQEMLSLDCETMLYRLFNQEELRLFNAEPVSFACTCSRLRIAKTLNAMGRHELEDMLGERPIIEVTCEFCGAAYNFDKIDIEVILRDGVADAYVE